MELAVHSSALFVISAKELVYFNCSMYADEYSFSEKSEKIISLADAAGILTDYYANLASLSRYEFNSVKLVYVPVGLNDYGFVYEPAWQFDGVKIFDSEGNKIIVSELIFAKTGIRYGNYG